MTFTLTIEAEGAPVYLQPIPIPLPRRHTPSSGGMAVTNPAAGAGGCSLEWFDATRVVMGLSSK